MGTALTIAVNRPVSELYAFAINPANTPKWIDSIAVEETNEWPIQLGTIYRNRGEAGEWTEYTVTALKENKLFELKEKDGGYRVRYTFTSLSPTSSRLEYSELVEGGEIEQPLTQETLDKLKRAVESMKIGHYDVAIIGLGAMGSAALYQLSKTGLNVIGIDQYVPPHTLGSSFGESRVTRQAIGEGAIYTPLVQRANEIWKELERLSGEELLNHCGMLLAGHKEHRFMQNTLQAAEQFSIEHELLTAEEVERRFPAIKVSGKDHVFYFEPGSGYLKPEKCIEVQLRLAQQNGAETLLNTTIKAINESSEGVELTLQNGETIVADKVIVASGPWIKDMLPKALGPILKTYLQTQYWFAVDPEHADALQPGKMPVFLCGNEKKETTRSFYNFPLVNGAQGGMKFAMHESDLEIGPDDKDVAKPVTSAEEMYKFISPYIGHIKPETIRSANCLYTVTPDEGFIIDFAPASKRVVLASACSGHGFKHSAAIGEVLTQMVTDGKTEIDISPFALGRFEV